MSLSHKRLAWSFILLLPLLWLGPLFSQTEKKGLPESFTWDGLANEIEDLWPERECAHDISYYSGYRMVSIACTGDFTSRTRQKILDMFFKNRLVMKNESHRLDKKSGLYLYKLQDSKGHASFVKIYVRDARILWPIHERSLPQVALYVQNINTAEQLVEWQTLGIALTYGVMPGRKDTAHLLEQVNMYGQEAWIRLAMESSGESKQDKFLESRMLTTAEGRNSSELGHYLDIMIPDGSIVTGVSSYEGSTFLNDVISLRNLFTQLRRRGIHYFLDTQNAEMSGGYDTARIMSLNAFRSDFLFPENEEEMMETWKEAIIKAREKGTVIIVVDAGNYKARDFLKIYTSTVEKIFEYSFISELPGNE